MAAACAAGNCRAALVDGALCAAGCMPNAGSAYLLPQANIPDLSR